MAQAEPTVSLTLSAEMTPIMRLWFLRKWLTTASSISSPAMRKEVALTMPAKESTAISVVPPPISTMREPRGSVTGKSQPTPAAMGSGIR